MGKIKKYALYSFAAIVGVILTAQLIWLASGTGEWELKKDQGGIKVYTMKKPWKNLVAFRAVYNLDYSMSHMVAALVDDHSLINCQEWYGKSCVGFEPIKPWDTESLSDVNMWVFNFRMFGKDIFKLREMIIESTVTQDKDTYVTTVHVKGAPDAIPENDCCVRVRNIDNSWTYTPLPDGGIEVDFKQDWDRGGLFPDFILNFGLGVEGTHAFVSKRLNKLLDNEKYKTARFDFIHEPYLDATVKVD
ncbi:hypothetical protein A7985_22640 [Pseudoalteromonas luteoviolacea]|uniref:START domain-containing protein n=1 Tax=Pseudoalteromonas luteoviolacea TaxID=43657 RepID=A0A1C0TK41_9GAMM|nr:hypothetical protein [Pseudoalteromonas luteoviolacea]MBQ4813827.1 hypothetical protein [Pseudoalteromonas luteoviolacea]OCQ18817.1 hypothetical protein A7985_22640 [Pseudoalteromonas luteoviolacea]